MKMKKLLAAALAATMMLSSMVTSFVASAAETVGTITVGTAEVELGVETADVDVTINFTKEGGVTAPHDLFTLTAPEGFTITDASVTYEGTAQEGSKGVYIDPDGEDFASGKILLEAPVDEMAPTVTKIVVTVTYAIADTVVAGTYDITVDSEIADITETDLALDEIDGTVTVIAPHVCTPAEAVEENRVESTCTVAGSYDSVVYCSECNEEISRDTIELPLADHTPGEAVAENEVAATCGAAGSYDSVVYCTVCNEELSRDEVTVPATGEHTAAAPVEENRTESTCTVAGSYDSVVYCSVCNAEISRETIALELAAHTPGEAVEENRVEAQPGVAGSYDTVVYCTVCDEELSRTTNEIPALPVEPVGPVLDENIVFNGEKMQFSNTINVLLRINKELVKSYTSLEVIVVPTVYNAGNEVVGEEIVIPVSSGTTKNWNVYYEGIGMYAMALPFDAYVKCYDAEGNYVAHSNVSTYNPIELVKAVYVAGSTDATQKKLNSLVTDTLNLATKAQVYFANQSQYAGSDLAADVAAGNVANKDWPQDCATTAYADLNTVNSIEHIAPFTVTDSKLSFLGDLNGAPVFTCKFSKYQTAFPDLSKLKLELSYTEVYGESSVVTDTIEGDEWQIAGKSVVAPASLVALYDGNKTVTGVLTYDGVEVIRFQYSLESYISENIGSTDTNFDNLLKAVAYFNVSSRAYFGTN